MDVPNESPKTRSAYVSTLHVEAGGVVVTVSLLKELNASADVAAMLERNINDAICFGLMDMKIRETRWSETRSPIDPIFIDPNVPLRVGTVFSFPPPEFACANYDLEEMAV